MEITQILVKLIRKLKPRCGIPAHVCTCGAPGCLTLEEAQKRYLVDLSDL